MRRIRVGIIGTGFIGPAHVDALRRLPNVDVVGLADIDEAAARGKADALGVPAAFGDYHALLSCPDIEAVHICTPNHLHARMATDALNAGKHVVCEKPLAVDVGEAAALVELAARTGLVNAVHFNVRYYPLMRQVRLMRESGELGNVFSIHGSYLQDWLFRDTDWNWRLEPGLSGRSRAVADIGSHWMDLVEHVSGLRITEVMADFATFHPVRRRPVRSAETYSGRGDASTDTREVPIETEDYATVLFHFDNGAHGALTVSQVAAGRKNRISLEIDGSREAVAWDSECPNALWIGRRDEANGLLLKDPPLAHPQARALMGFPGGHAEGFPDTSKQLFREVYARIAGGASGGAPSFPTFADGFRELVLCERILQSRDSRTWVRV